MNIGFASLWLRRLGGGMLLCIIGLLLNSCGSSFSQVVIDAGHGGHDSGATRAGVHEKHLALDVATRVYQLLEEEGVSVRMTRSDDRFLTLGERVRIADSVADSALVSIHFNSARNSRAHGIETFYYYSGSKASQKLAQSVQNQLIAYTGAENRGVKTAGFYVLRKTSRPAILVECGFVSNRSDRSRALRAEYRQQLAQAIVAGILREISTK